MTSRSARRGRFWAGGGRGWLVVLVVLAGVPFGLGKLFELALPDPFDSGAYVHSARRVLEGARIGVDEQPSARSGTLAVNIVGVALGGFSETGPTLIQGVFQITALALMLVALLRPFGRLAAGSAVVMAAVYLSAPVIAKYGNVKEQYMIACMVIGVACWLVRQTGGGRVWAVACGAALAWAPLFKPSGVSALLAVTLCIALGPLLGSPSWRRTRLDALLFVAGAALGLLPVIIWLAHAGAPCSYWPYARLLGALVPGGGDRGADYISDSRRLMPLAKQAPIVFRHYQIVALPILLALSSVGIAVIHWARRLGRGGANHAAPAGLRFVPLLTGWWLLDMIFVWVSPRSYEQYYLPLTASAAMLGAFAVSHLQDQVRGRAPLRRLVAAVSGAAVAGVLLFPVVFGLSRSPFSGTAYESRRRGYVQRYHEALARLRGGLRYPWEVLGDAVRACTAPTHGIYVWGWYPGIYVRAQRLASTPRACEGSMHILPPEELSARVEAILDAFDRHPPEVIVDSRKVHFPWDRPPLELWPRTRDGYLSPDRQSLATYDAAYEHWLASRYGGDEVARYRALRPLREHVMSRFLIAAEYGDHVLLRRRRATLPPGVPPRSSPPATRG